MNADQSTDLKGWLPVDAVVVEGRPGLMWMEMSGVSLTEPFFQQTVERARKENRAERFTEFDVLLQLEKQLESVEPTGFIFHSSRCGSTLVANACRAVSGSIVLSEANAIDKLIARFITDVDNPVKESLYSVFLRGVVHALAQRRTGNERHLFIKFACCSFAQLERIKRIWPAVPWLFLYRDPVETIVSNMRDVPPWLIDNDRRVLCSIIGDGSEMSLEELCARTIGSLFSTAYRLANANSMLLNYNQLSVPVIASVLNFFNVSLSSEELETIARTSEVYSKEVSGTRAFVADVDAKQKLASDLIREMSERWAGEPYRLLENLVTRVNPVKTFGQDLQDLQN
ncbi:MAG TPA: hypothetical protein VFX63_15150 [Pyrinomonadaceae bacterium]|nr:hypothetical protein [Pyrinomonadaceae bacterium]